MAKSIERLSSSTELLAAVKRLDHKEVERLLTRFGANVESRDYEEASPYKSPILAQAKSEEGAPKKKEAKKIALLKTPLHIACDLNDLEMVKLLIAHGANVNSVDKDDMTPLYYAILRKSRVLCDYLLSCGANLEHREGQMRTPLYWAACLAELDMLEYLIQLGCNPNTPSKLGRTALSKACWNGQVEVVRRLLLCKNVSARGKHQLSSTSTSKTSSDARLCTMPAGAAKGVEKASRPR
jgi:ankyrin repeat protein